MSKAIEVHNQLTEAYLRQMRVEFPKPIVSAAVMLSELYAAMDYEKNGTWGDLRNQFSDEEWELVEQISDELLLVPKRAHAEHMVRNGREIK